MMTRKQERAIAWKFVMPYSGTMFAFELRLKDYIPENDTDLVKVVGTELAQNGDIIIKYRRVKDGFLFDDRRYRPNSWLCVYREEAPDSRL